MQQQNEKGIYVYYLAEVYYADGDVHRTKTKHIYYSSLEEFFRCNREYNIKSSAGYHVSDTVCQKIIRQSRKRNRWGYVRYYDIKHCHSINCKEHGRGDKCWVVCDETGQVYSPDRLIGLYREWIGNYRSNYCSWVPGAKHGGQTRYYRKIRTSQERKWAHAWDDEEFSPKVRGARQGHNLPSSWADYHRHCEKSWKFQSNRKHQWKA